MAQQHVQRTSNQTGQRLGYARVSTSHQSVDQQIDALVAAGVDPSRIYRDIASGVRTDREGLAALLDHAREGDTVTVVALDRSAEP